MRCRHCGAELQWRVGPQWSGWIAPGLEGHLRDVCYREEDGTWRGHRLDALSERIERLEARLEELVQTLETERKERKLADQELSWAGWEEF